MSSLTTYNGLQIVTPTPTGTGGQALNTNFKKLSTKIAATNPTASDDNTAGFGVGSRWYNSVTSTELICTDATTSVAVWSEIAGNPFDQSLNTTDTPTFAGATITGIDMAGGGIYDSVAGEVALDSDVGFYGTRVRFWFSPYWLGVDSDGIDTPAINSTSAQDLYILAPTTNFDGGTISSVTQLSNGSDPTYVNGVMLWDTPFGSNVTASEGHFDNLFSDIAGFIYCNELFQAPTIEVGDIYGAATLEVNYISGTGSTPFFASNDGNYWQVANVASLELSGQSSAPSSPAAGTIYFDSTDNHFYGFDGSTWKQLDN